MARQRPSDPFLAQYNGPCEGCGGEIEAGDEIVMWKGRAHHNDEDCCDGLAEPDPQPYDSSGPRDRWT